MTLLVPRNGQGDTLEYFVNRSAPQNLVLRLFTSNITPAETDTAEQYTEPQGDEGYSPIELQGDRWSAPTEGAPSHTKYPEQIFQFDGPLGFVYGYYMTRATSGRIAIAERFSNGPYRITKNGDQIQVTPIISAE